LVVARPAGSDETADRGFIDVNAQIGPAFGRAGGARLEDLTRERRSHGVRLSLVRHRTALLDDTRLGNRQILEASEADPGLIPIAVVRPDRTDMLDAAASLDPRFAGFWLEGRARPGIGSLATDALVRSAARAGKPLFVPVTSYGEASSVGAATADLGVPVVLVGCQYDNVVDVLAAVRRFDHLYLETSRMAYLDGIEIAVREVGADRILWGTGAPFRAMQSTLNVVGLARLADDEKRAILAGNARRLLGLPSTSVELPQVDRPERAIDVHAHSGPLPHDVAELTDEELLAELARRNNTRYAIASSVLAIDADSEAGNRELVEGCRRLPNRLGYLYVDPDDLPATRDQIRRWGESPGIVGAKVSCETSERLTGSPQVWELFNLLAEFGKPVKIHNDGADWDQHLLRIARQHPRLPIIVAHGGLGFPDMPAARLAAAADNVYVEMCSSFAQISIVRDVVAAVPRHKLMFGTDAPLLDPGFVLGTYQDAAIPADQQDDVFYANAARLFGIT
jgi:predicted TIM-barrel fold metal-dependent hydrolase